MAVTTWRYPGTTASVASSGDVAWANTGNIAADDGTNANVNPWIDGPQTSEILKATNFGFVSGDFPTGWVLTGIEIEVDRYQTAFDAQQLRDHTVQLYDASGTLTGSNVADTGTNLPTSATVKAYGGAGNMLGTSLTASDLQDADFGVAFKVNGTGGAFDIGEMRVDYIRVRAHISPPPSGYSIVGIGTVAETTATGGNLTLTEPAGVQDEDLLIACIPYRSNATFANTGSIWTKQEEENSGNTTANGTGSIASGVAFWGIRGSSAPDLTFERTGGNVARGCIVAYRPATGYRFELDTSTSLTLAAASTSFTMSGFTPAQDATLLVFCGFGARNTTLSAFDAATDPTTASGTTTDTTTNPYYDTWLRRVTSGTSTGADCTIAIADAVQETATATGNFTYTAGSSARHAGAVLAFRLVAAGGDVTAALTGQALVSSLGDETVAAVASVSVALTGQAIVSSHGNETVAVSASTAITGHSLSASHGNESVSGAAVVSVSGQGIASSLGNEVVTGSAVVSVTGQLLSASIGTAAAGVITAFEISGHALTSSLGNEAVSASAAVLVSGQAIVSTHGNESVSSGAAVPLSGQLLSSGLGNESVVGVAIVQAIGTAISSGIGTAIATGTAGSADVAVSLTGHSGILTLGNEVVSATANVAVTGSQIDSGLGSVVVSSSSVISVTGIGIVASHGDESVAVGSNAAVTGHIVSASVSSVSVSSEANSTVDLTGGALSAALGAALVSSTAVVPLLGEAIAASAGMASSSVGVALYILGQQADSLLGSVSVAEGAGVDLTSNELSLYFGGGVVWAVITGDPAAGWVTIPNGSGGWAPITGGSGAWAVISGGAGSWTDITTSPEGDWS